MLVFSRAVSELGIRPFVEHIAQEGGYASIDWLWYPRAAGYTTSVLTTRLRAQWLQQQEYHAADALITQTRDRLGQLRFLKQAIDERFAEGGCGGT